MTNMKIIQGIEIADHAFALLLGLTRRIDLAMEWKKTETWNGGEFRPLYELQWQDRGDRRRRRHRNANRRSRKGVWDDRDRRRSERHAVHAVSRSHGLAGSPR